MTNPFGSIFESFGAPRGPLAEKVHQEQFETLVALLQDGEGQLISLRAPRAGYGKTMLLSRLQQSRQAQTIFVPVHLADGRRVEGEMILEEILTQMTDLLPAGGGLTRLDLCTRKLFAQGLVPLVYSGEVPCQDREGALASLRNRPTEAFDFHHEDAAIAQWSREQFALLGPRLSAVLSKSSGASGRDTSYWTDLFFNYATRTPGDVLRTSDMMDTVFGSKSRFRSGAGFMEGLSALINLITVVEPMVMVLDEVEGLSRDSDSALRAASCLTSLWEAAPRLSVILSINDDIWDSAFIPRLPLGLKDRLEDIVIRLDSLTKEEACALVTVRAGDEAARVLQHLDLENGELYPRDILRKARSVWEKRDQKIEQPAPASLTHPLAKLPRPNANQRASVVYQKSAETPPGEASGVALQANPVAEFIKEHSVVQGDGQTASEAQGSVNSIGFKTHASSEVDLVLEDGMEDDFVQAPKPAGITSPFARVTAAPAVYPPAQVKQVALPKAFPVQRLEAALSAPFQEAPAATPPAPENPGALAVFEQVFPVSQSAEAASPIESPFSVNPNPVPQAQVKEEQMSPPPLKVSPFDAVSGPAPEQEPPSGWPFETPRQPASVSGPAQPSAPPPPEPFQVPASPSASPFPQASSQPQQAAPAPTPQPANFQQEVPGQPQANASSTEDRLAANTAAIDQLLEQFRNRND